MQDIDKQAENAIKCLLKYIGDNPEREQLKETPKRILNRYKKTFSGYQANLQKILETPTIPCNKDMGMVMIPNIKFISFCEHHFLPMIGKINIGYLPSKSLVGIGTIVKIVNVFTHRLQLQENLTKEIATTVEKYLHPKGIAVTIQADHYCINRQETGSLYNQLLTHYWLGSFKVEKELQIQFLNSINSNPI